MEQTPAAAPRPALGTPLTVYDADWRQRREREVIQSCAAFKAYFNDVIQDYSEEVCFGRVWARDGIDRKTRSMINLTMLAALNRGSEFRLHLRAALSNGVTRDEIKEILMQIGAYCGIPACLEAFKIATEVFKEIDGAKG